MSNFSEILRLEAYLYPLLALICSGNVELDCDASFDALMRCGFKAGVKRVMLWDSTGTLYSGCLEVVSLAH